MSSRSNAIAFPPCTQSICVYPWESPLKILHVIKSHSGPSRDDCYFRGDWKLIISGTRERYQLVNDVIMQATIEAHIVKGKIVLYTNSSCLFRMKLTQWILQDEL